MYFWGSTIIDIPGGWNKDTAWHIWDYTCPINRAPRRAVIFTNRIVDPLLKEKNSAKICAIEKKRHLIYYPQILLMLLTIGVPELNIDSNSSLS